MKFKKTLTTFIVGAVAAVMLVGVAGCGSSSETEATPDPAAYAPDAPGGTNGNGDITEPAEENGNGDITEPVDESGYGDIAEPAEENGNGDITEPAEENDNGDIAEPADENGNDDTEQNALADRFFLDLPEYALLSEFHVGVPIVYGEEIGSNSTPPWGHTNWTYRDNLQPATEENRADPRFLMYADRRGIQDHPDREFYGWLNFQAAHVPEWLHGAHFIGMGHEFRRTDRWPTPYFVFTAGQELYAFLGLSQRMHPDNYFDMLDGWELIHPVQYVSVIGGLSDRNSNFEDKSTMSEIGLLPPEGVHIPERLYLFQRRMVPGETVEVEGASLTSAGTSGFALIMLTPEQYEERVPGGWDTVTAEYFVENLRPWRDDDE